MKLIISLFILIISPAFGQALDINIAIEEKSSFIRFDIKNSSKQNYFCRDITIGNVDYFFRNSDEYFYSLDAKITNKYITSNSIVNFIQDDNPELKDILNLGRELKPRFDKKNLSIDCEPKDSRMNNVFVLDDRAKCGGELELKSYVFDGPNLTLANSEKKINSFGADARYFKLNTKNNIVIQDKKNIMITGLKGQSLTDSINIDRLNDGEILIAALAIDESRIALAIYSIEQGLLLNVYNNIQQTYSLIKKVEFSQFSLKVKNFNGTTITNIAEIEKFYKNHLYKMFENISIFSRRTSTHSIIDLVVMARTPSVELVASSYNFSTNKWNYKLKPIEISENLNLVNAVISIDHADDIEISIKKELEIDEVFALVNKNVFVKEGLSFGQLNFKDYQIVASENKIIISSDNNTKRLDGFCSIKGIFSDLLISSGEFDINQMYDGRTVLSKAVRAKSYAETLKIISMGASVNTPDILKKYPIDYAVDLRNVKLVSLLLENGADIVHEVKNESLFSMYLNNVLLDFAILSKIEKKATLVEIHEMFSTFKRYNYIFKKDKNYEKFINIINTLEDRQAIFKALEVL